MQATDWKDAHNALRRIRIEDFAAQLTDAVYPLVLRRVPKKLWLKLELGLWKVLTKTTRSWIRQRRPADDDLETWREGLLGALSGSVIALALSQGVDRRHLFELEFQLHKTFHSLTPVYSSRSAKC